jgi:predicted nuclease of predicted toxin-antitoxin system
MRLFADTNITAPAVRALRAAGHDVIHSAERESDPGDAALLAEAASEQRVFLTKDNDIGALVFNEGAPHRGVILIDDLGDASEEATLLLDVIRTHVAQLEEGTFLRVDASGRTRPR